MQSTRCFIAVPIDPPTLAMAKRVIDRLRPKIDHVKWSELNDIHITLKFLGEIDNRLLPDICGIMRDACQDVSGMILTVEGIGAFPQGKAPRVLWGRVIDDSGELTKIQNRLDEQLATLGIAPEMRAFNPHLTFGRLSKKVEQEKVTEAIETVDSVATSPLEVNEVTLFATIRDRSRLIHEPIETIEFYRVAVAMTANWS